MLILRGLESTSSTDNHHSEPFPLNEKNCNLFGPFSFLVQFILGLLSFGVLIIKRYRETYKRPWKIWLFDVSKQLFSAITVHIFNLFIAILLSIDNETQTRTDECMWYFVNLLTDSTVGVFICFALMLLVDKLAKKHNFKELQSGLYFEKVEKEGKTKIRLKLKMYFTQLFIWLAISVIVKSILLGFTKLFSFYLELIGEFILKPFSWNEKLELSMVMVIFPVVFNAIQFWVLDNILKLPQEEIKQINEAEEEPSDKEDSLNSINSENPDDSVKNKNKLTELQEYPNNFLKSDYVPPANILINEKEKEDLSITKITYNTSETVKSEDNLQNTQNFETIDLDKQK